MQKQILVEMYAYDKEVSGTFIFNFVKDLRKFLKEFPYLKILNIKRVLTNYK